MNSVAGRKTKADFTCCFASVLEGERRSLDLHLLLWVTDSTEDAFSASENSTLKVIATLLDV